MVLMTNSCVYNPNKLNKRIVITIPVIKTKIQSFSIANPIKEKITLITGVAISISIPN